MIIRLTRPEWGELERDELCVVQWAMKAFDMMKIDYRNDTEDVKYFI